jgi:hypothetical protein
MHGSPQAQTEHPSHLVVGEGAVIDPDFVDITLEEVVLIPADSDR